MSYLSDNWIKRNIGLKAFSWWVDNREVYEPRHGSFGEGSIAGATVIRDLYERHLKKIKGSSLDARVKKQNELLRKVLSVDTRLKAKDALLKEAAGAFEEVLGGSKIDLCAHLSHPLSGDRHKLGEPCPPTERIAALFSRINTHINSDPT